MNHYQQSLVLGCVDVVGMKGANTSFKSCLWTNVKAVRPDIDYDAATKKMSWKLTYSGLTGPATAAHFHGPAEAGKNAGVALAIPNATSSPAEGSATLTDVQANDLMAGKYYVNVHTAANPDGEIRGQVTK